MKQKYPSELQQLLGCLTNEEQSVLSKNFETAEQQKIECINNIPFTALIWNLIFNSSQAPTGREREIFAEAYAVLENHLPNT